MLVSFDVFVAIQTKEYRIPVQAQAMAEHKLVPLPNNRGHPCLPFTDGSKRLMQETCLITSELRAYTKRHFDRKK